MGYFQVLTIAIVVTVIALWKMNSLLQMVSAASWFGMLAYHLSSPPSGVTSGDNVDVFIMAVYAGMAMAILIMGITRGRDYGWNFRGDKLEKSDARPRRRTVMEMDEAEYRKYIGSKARSARR